MISGLALQPAHVQHRAGGAPERGVPWRLRLDAAENPGNTRGSEAHSRNAELEENEHQHQRNGDQYKPVSLNVLINGLTQVEESSKMNKFLSGMLCPGYYESWKRPGLHHINFSRVHTRAVALKSSCHNLADQCASMVTSVSLSSFHSRGMQRMVGSTYAAPLRHGCDWSQRPMMFADSINSPDFLLHNLDPF